MSLKFDYMIKILNMLDRGENISRESIAGDLAATTKSVERYIKTLRVAGFPIAYDRLKKSYIFGEGFGLRKPAYTTGEQLAFGIARNMLKSFGPGMSRALGMIEKKALFGKQLLPAHIVVSGVKQPEKVELWFELLNQAIMGYQRVTLEYSTAYKKDEKSCRTVDPYYLYLWDNLWYLRAYCHTRKAPLSFALDKIRDLKVMAKHFVPNPEINPEKELQGGFGAVLDGPETEVVVRIDTKHQPYVTRIRWHQSQTETMLPDGRLEMRFKVKGTDAIKLWLYRGLPHIEVIEPQSLREEMRQELEIAAAKLIGK